MPPATTATSTAPAMRKRRLAEVTGLVPGRRESTRLSSRNPLESKQLFSALAAPHELGLRAGNENLGRARARVVVGAHAHSVGARRHDREQIALLRRNPSLLGKKIAAFADRPDDVVKRCSALGLFDRLDVMPGAVERWPQKIVHRRIDD